MCYYTCAMKEIEQRHGLHELNLLVKKLDDEVSQFLIKGDLYRYGAPGVAVDLTTAEQWYREAAQLGDWEGMEALADVLELRDKYDEANRWRKRLVFEMAESC